MKTILLTLAIAFSCTIFAQGDLQFNQVVTKTGTSHLNAPTYTVPAGKIWKITGVFGRKPTTNGTALGLNINGVEIEKINGRTNDFNYINNDPIWLNSGDTVAIYAQYSSGDYAWMISIIEFNVVP